jgi:hypothetical protein
MKTNQITLIILMITASFEAAAEPITETRSWTQTYPVSTSQARLEIGNIWGDVRVSAGSDDKITVAIHEVRSAQNQTTFDRSLDILRLNVIADESGVSMQVGDPSGSWRSGFWNKGNPCRRCEVVYTFDVQVPVGTRVDVSTVNDGQINISGIKGGISASNVNGPIFINELYSCEFVESINGVVKLNFDKAPSSDCNIETLNGDISLTMPENTGLDVAITPSNGRMTTNFQVDTYLIPPQIDHIQENGKNRYRIQQLAGIRLAGGGPTFAISSFNGDISIQKTQ